MVKLYHQNNGIEFEKKYIFLADLIKICGHVVF